MKVLAFLALFVAVALGGKVLYQSQSVGGVFELREHADPSSVVNFRIALKQRNVDLVDKLFWDIVTPGSGSYQKYMTKKEVDDMVNPFPATVQPVLDYLKRHQLIVSHNGGDYLSVYGFAKDIEQALSCKLMVVENTRTGEKSVKVHPPQYILPDYVASAVDFVQGITQVIDKKHSMQHPTIKNLKNTFDAGSQDAVVPLSSKNQYNAAYTITTSSSQCVAEFSENAYISSDMHQFVSQIMISGKEDPNHIDNIGGHGSSVGTEATLDIQWVTAMGYNGTNYYYTLSQWIVEFAQDLYTMSSPPLISSISWGADERSEGITVNTKFDTEVQKLGLRGIGICAASGDSGAPGTSCGGSQYVFNPSYPAASPVVLSVGATMFQTAQSSGSGLPSICNSGQYTCATSGVEVPATDGNFASGGGYSVFMPTPAYQKAVVQAYNSDSSIPKPPSSYYNSSHRGFPDVAANGLFNLIVDNGQVEPVGGTSASSPQWGGMIAILNDYLIKNGKKQLGFPNGLLYKAAAEQSNTFKSTGNLNTNNKDGCQYGFVSNPNGWDPVNGLGTGNVGNLMKYISANLDMFEDL